MHESIEAMLTRYHLKTTVESLRALREIMQEIALVGLWRGKFFEKAAFYGGTALRILYGLDRFSEDLDFSLLKVEETFSLEPYHQAVKEELNAFGFDVEVSAKQKNIDTPIESTFVKANTKQSLIYIGFNKQIAIANEAKIKIKLEVDTCPPAQFTTEAKILKEPIPISIRTYIPSDLFAGKMHAVLCRGWQARIKGRDWYDFVWFVRKGIPLNLLHLEQRMWQNKCLEKHERLTESLFQKRLESKICDLNIENALFDIRPFVPDPSLLISWSKEYFYEVSKQIKFVENR